MLKLTESNRHVSTLLCQPSRSAESASKTASPKLAGRGNEPAGNLPTKSSDKECHGQLRVRIYMDLLNLLQLYMW